MKKGIDLATPKQVMQAFLSGQWLQNSNYSGNEMWLYLSDSGFICEEDGAGAKSDRVPITMRGDVTWWTLDRTGFPGGYDLLGKIDEIES